MGQTAVLRVTCLQLALPGSAPKRARVEHVVGLIQALPATDLVVLPELWPVGYFQFERYQREAEPLDGPTVAALAAVARRRGVHLLGGSLVERAPDGRLHNTSVLLGPDGGVALVYRKIHVFGHRSREAGLLSGGDRLDVAATALGVVAATTCYDLRFPELYRVLADQGAELVLVPAAWPRARLDHWLVLTRARALENQVFLVACNNAGQDGDAALAGNSVVVGPWGQVLAAAGDREQALTAELDLRHVHDLRREFPVLGDRRLSVLNPFVGGR